MFSLLLVAAAFTACGSAIADATAPKGRWAIRTLGGYRVPYDTTRVGTWVIAETLTVEANPSKLRVAQVLLTRELNNKRTVKVDTVDMSLSAGLGCSRFAAGATKREQESRDHMRQVLGEVGRMIGPRPYDVSQEMSTGPYAVAFEGSTLSLLEQDCGAGATSRTYRRVADTLP